jgi:hypothetical protein
VSRFDPATGAEVLVAFNTSDRAITAQVAVEPGSLRFSALAGACPRWPAARERGADPARLWLCGLCRHQGQVMTSVSKQSPLVARRLDLPDLPAQFWTATGTAWATWPGSLRIWTMRLLGVEAIWISPFFTSPMADFGYDVADYCDVDPIFGTLADFDALVEKAHGLGLKVTIDMVFAHTSDKHPGSNNPAPPARTTAPTGTSGPIPRGRHAAQQLAVGVRRPGPGTRGAGNITCTSS